MLRCDHSVAVHGGARMFTRIMCTWIMLQSLWRRDDINFSCGGLKTRVVLWPQSTKTSVGPPDSAMWWSGGLLKTFND